MSQPGNGPRRVGPWPRGSLLAALEPEIRDELLRLGTWQQFASGDFLLMEGDRSSKHVFLIAGGCVKVVSHTDDGKTALLAIRMDGDVVGELASLDGSPRAATVIAVGSCDVRRISQSAFLAFLSRHPAAALAMSRTVAGKLRHATWQRVAFSTSPVPVRLARVLLYLAARFGEQRPEGVLIRVHLSQPDLAALVGAREHSVHKGLRALREKGVIHTGYRKILIIDMNALKEEAGDTGIPPEYGV
ncbi:Crp/Fnr family transcriptional regulator [Microtetraspora niveoalba]|uniref:Crp/Fnr family transcriptional regulator n=1 Tax=Microtetraspora niveoalba TaxID=46175 RepID=UPI00082A20A1|nr:Crp/Fnr family transcriptional regulator [Microtetraspora niveoalba]